MVKYFEVVNYSSELADVTANLIGLGLLFSLTVSGSNLKNAAHFAVVLCGACRDTLEYSCFSGALRYKIA